MQLHMLPANLCACPGRGHVDDAARRYLWMRRVLPDSRSEPHASALAARPAHVLRQAFQACLRMSLQCQPLSGYAWGKHCVQYWVLTEVVIISLCLFYLFRALVVLVSLSKEQ